MSRLLRRPLAFTLVQRGCVPLLLLGLVAAGCSHSERKEAERGFVGVPAPEFPALLCGPAGTLLTNLPGFSAQAVVESGAPAGGLKLTKGTLLGREGKLLFAPDPDETLPKRARTAGFSFIWSVKDRQGWVLSEGLQACAPATVTVSPTNVVISANGQPPARLDGHACEARDAVVALSDGVVASFRLQCAADLHGLPLRIEAIGNAPPLVVTLSRVRPEVPAADLFGPPSGFAKYETTQAMADELAMRQHNLRNPHRDFGGDDLPPSGMRSR
jgi:hypothetical protein